MMLEQLHFSHSPVLHRMVILVTLLLAMLHASSAQMGIFDRNTATNAGWKAGQPGATPHYGNLFSAVMLSRIIEDCRDLNCNALEKLEAEGRYGFIDSEEFTRTFTVFPWPEKAKASFKILKTKTDVFIYIPRTHGTGSWMANLVITPSAPISGFPCYVHGGWEATYAYYRNELKIAVKKFTENKKLPVNIVGYSQGGSGALFASYELNSLGYNINSVVTLGAPSPVPYLVPAGKPYSCNWKQYFINNGLNKKIFRIINGGDRATRLPPKSIHIGRPVAMCSKGLKYWGDAVVPNEPCADTGDIIHHYWSFYALSARRMFGVDQHSLAVIKRWEAVSKWVDQRLTKDDNYCFTEKDCQQGCGVTSPTLKCGAKWHCDNDWGWKTFTCKPKKADGSRTCKYAEDCVSGKCWLGTCACREDVKNYCGSTSKFCYGRWWTDSLKCEYLRAKGRFCHYNGMCKSKSCTFATCN